MQGSGSMKSGKRISPWALPDDPLGAFCRDNHIAVAGAATGPLIGTTFAVKDVFDVAGARTGLGHPEWLRSHPPARRTAKVVQQLLDAGASLAGKTHSDELCYSLTGENVHYGTPLNPWAPERIPGGSSNGSGSAVAGGLVDFALGSDCGGSVRVPASYCGIYGMRPSHGRVSLEGVVPFAPSFDCVGWFARDPGILLQVGRVLLGDDSGPKPFRRLLLASDGFELADAAVTAALAPGIAKLASLVAPPEKVRLGGESGLEGWGEAFRTIQGFEVWVSMGEWITRHRPQFGPGIRERFEAASLTTADEVHRSEAIRQEAVRRLEELLQPGDLLCLPTTPRPAPLRGLEVEDIEIAYRHRAMALLCSAGLAGLPQISLPLGAVAGLPVGLSIMGARGTDIDLLGVAQTIGGTVAAARLPGEANAHGHEGDGRRGRAALMT